MFWQVPEMWEITGALEIIGSVLMFSLPISFLLLVLFCETVMAIRRQKELVNSEAGSSLVYVRGLFENLSKASAVFSLSCLVIYEMCWFLFVCFALKPW